MKRSRRYQEVKKQIPSNKYYSLSEGLQFLQKNNKEKIKNIEVSFSLNWVKQKNTFKSQVILPYPVPLKGKLAIIKEDLPADVIDSLQKSEDIALLTVAEVRQKVEGKKKVQ